METLWVVVTCLSLAGLLGKLIAHGAKRAGERVGQRHRLWAAVLLAVAALGSGAEAIKNVGDFAGQYVPAPPPPCNTSNGCAPPSPRVTITDNFDGTNG